MPASPWPDFFLVGAPKCGTTALATYLGEHPAIQMSHPKEPFFFADDFPGVPRPASTVEGYLELFASHASTARVRGEATAMYLYSDVAVPNLLRVRPDARLVVMVRNPVDLAHAFHSEMCYSQNEDEPDFQRAWDLQERRARGDAIPSTCWEPRFLRYREVARLGAQVERLLGRVDRRQVKILVFDDFVADTRASYEEVLDFLGVASDDRRDFPRINENKRVQHRWLARLTQRPPAILSRGARATKRLLRRPRMSFLGPLREANLRRGPRAPIDPALRARIAEELADDVALLGRLLERDLGGWLRPKAPGRAVGSPAPAR